MKTLGKNIKTLRQLRGWSQEQIATKLGITAPAFSKIECGLTDVNLSRLEQIAELFELKVIELLMYHDNQEIQKFNNEMIEVKAQLAEKDLEIIQLQKKIISLLETTISV